MTKYDQWKNREFDYRYKQQSTARQMKSSEAHPLSCECKLCIAFIEEMIIISKEKP